MFGAENLQVMRIQLLLIIEPNCSHSIWINFMV
jgi:hypothetical protein